MAVKLDFSTLPFRDNAFSQRPTAVLDAAAPKGLLLSIMEIVLLETGSRVAREKWQRAQLRNLLQFVSERSPLWRGRIGSSKHSDMAPADLPVQSRRDVVEQVAKEGALIRPQDRISVHEHTTSGSSGVPVKFFFSAVNSQYNYCRSLAEFFLQDWDLSANYTRVLAAKGEVTGGLSVQNHESWIGDLHTLMEGGRHKHIDYFNPDIDELVRELERDEIGYLVSSTRILDAIFSVRPLDFLKDGGALVWMPQGESVGSDLVDEFARLNIPIRATYSSEENGMIGFACPTCAGHYHVATSNVLVETTDETLDVDGTRLGRILVTSLHSYATPFIRYDVGDLGSLRETCPCGHDGPTIYNLQGRASSVLRRRDGRMTSFHIRGKDLLSRVKLTEFRIRQTAFDRLVVEIGGRTELSVEETSALRAFFLENAGPEFEIEIRAVPEIAWGASRKRPGFLCEIP